MNFVQRVTSAARTLASRKSADDAMTSSDLLSMLSGAGFSRSGAMVSWQNALAVSTVFGCVRVIAEDIAKVDFHLQLATGDTIVRADNHPVHDLLAFEPNTWQTPFEFRECITSFALLTGNGIAYKTRGIDGSVLELLPIPPQWVFIQKIPGKFALRYTITFPNGVGSINCGPEDVVHLRGPSFDGFVGADIVRLAREAVGLAMAGEEHQARIAEGSLQAPGYLTTPNTLTKDQVDEIKKFLKENKGGVRNAGDTPLFQNSLEYKEVGITGQKAEILMTRSFQVEEICRFFRIFPQMVGFTDKAMTHASAQDFFIAHVVHTLQPHASRWEQVINRDLLSMKERKKGYRAKLMLDDLMRGDPTTRGNYYKNLGQVRAITPNEVRIREGMNPLKFDYMDEPISPVNMQTGDGDGENDQTATPGAAKPDQSADTETDTDAGNDDETGDDENAN